MSKDAGVFPRPRLEDFLSGSEAMDHQRQRPNHPGSVLCHHRVLNLLSTELLLLTYAVDVDSCTNVCIA